MLAGRTRQGAGSEEATAHGGKRCMEGKGVPMSLPTSSLLPPTLLTLSQAKLAEIKAAIRRRSIDKLADELVGLF